MILALMLALQDPLAARSDTLRPIHDALRYDISITIPDTGARILGVTETAWRISSAAPVRVQLDTALTVTRAAWTGERSLVRGEWSRHGELIEFPHHHAVGDTATTRITYTGIVRDGLIIRANIYGDRAAFADNWPDRAHRWFPAQDQPSDKATVRFHVDVPRGWRAIALGILERVDTLRRGRTLWHYRMTHPVPVYTMVVGAGRMSVARAGDATCSGKCMPMSVWTFPQDSAWAVTGPFRRAPQMIQYFTRLVGAFPYAGLAHVESSTIFGGMENATAIFYPQEAYRDHTLSEGVVAHETAHQWFGDAVTEADWHHVWLSEGFATYFSALWDGHVGGDSAFRATMAAGAAGVFKSRVTDSPILDSTVTDLPALLSSNSYPKGAWVLHQLRGIVGDSAFFHGLRHYYERYRDGNALSSDFAAVMSGDAAQDLGWYFRQALTQPGYPQLDVRWSYADEVLTLVVRQTQKPEWGTYRIPALELRVDGRVHRIDIYGRETTVALPDMPRRPDTVEVDPRGWWLLQANISGAP